MATTRKRITLSLTKGDIRELDLLCQFFEENPTDVIKRGIELLHYVTFHEKNNNDYT